LLPKTKTQTQYTKPEKPFLASSSSSHNSPEPNPILPPEIRRCRRHRPRFRRRQVSREGVPLAATIPRSPSRP
jgi:hypothetical protein